MFRGLFKRKKKLTYTDRRNMLLNNHIDENVIKKIMSYSNIGELLTLSNDLDLTMQDAALAYGIEYNYRKKNVYLAHLIDTTLRKVACPNDRIIAEDNKIEFAKFLKAPFTEEELIVLSKDILESYNNNTDRITDESKEYYNESFVNLVKYY